MELLAEPLQELGQKSKVLWNKLFRAFQWSAYLRRAVLAIPHRNSQVSPHVTISVEFTTKILQPDSDLEEMISAADWALYQAKAAGRDRFVQNILVPRSK